MIAIGIAVGLVGSIVGYGVPLFASTWRSLFLLGAAVAVPALVYAGYRSGSLVGAFKLWTLLLYTPLAFAFVWAAFVGIVIRASTLIWPKLKGTRHLSAEIVGVVFLVLPWLVIMAGW